MTGLGARLGAARGPLAMMVGVLFFAGMFACVKVARAELPAMEIMLWRGVIGLPIAAVAMGAAPWSIQNRPVFLARVVFGFLAMGCFYTAAQGLSLADLSLLDRLQPVGVALLAPTLLGRRERASPWLWLLLLVGLGGAALILGPQLAVGNRYGLLALVAVLCSALAHTALRALGPTEDPRTVVLGFQIFSIVAAGLWIGLAEEGWPGLPQSDLWPWLLGVGLGAHFGQLLITWAYQVERAAPVSAASHLAPLWAILLDWWVFGVLPRPLALLGGLTLLGAAAALIWLGQRRPR